MQRHIAVHSWIACLLLLSGPVYAKDIGSWCNATAYGGSATITCHFKRDLNLIQKDFTLQHRRFNPSSMIPVLSCSWESETAMRCVEEVGYTFNKTVSDHFQVNIPQATSEHHDGQYICQIVTNPDGDLFLPCELNIAGIPHQPTDIYVSNSTLESVTICWQAPPDTRERVSYRIRYKRATPKSEFSYIDVAPGTSCFAIAGLTPGTRYQISILARNKFGSSVYRDLGKIANTSELQTCEKEVSAQNNTPGSLVIALTVLGVFVIGNNAVWVFVICRRRKQCSSLPCRKRKPKTVDSGSHSNMSAATSSVPGSIGNGQSAPQPSDISAGVPVTSVRGQRKDDGTSPWSTWSESSDDREKLTSPRSKRKADETTSRSSGSLSSEGTNNPGRFLMKSGRQQKRQRPEIPPGFHDLNPESQVSEEETIYNHI